MQFCVYRNKGKNKTYPYLLEVQSPWRMIIWGAAHLHPPVPHRFQAHKHASTSKCLF